MASTLAIRSVAPAAAIAAPACHSARAAGRRAAASVPAIPRFSEGLKMAGPVVSVRASVDEQFALISASCRRTGGRGGAMAARCDLGSEIFPLIPIMSGLTLVGVAIGFVLLRVEAWLEESE